MNQTVFITGVSSGIGHGLAKFYLDRGDQVYGVSRREPDFIGHDNFQFASIDVTDAKAVADRLPILLASVQKISTVVLNAGILGQLSDVRDAQIEDLKRIMDVNVWSNKFVLDSLLERYAIERVITMSSGAAVNGNRGWSGYSISKAALNMLTMLYARENEKTFFVAVAPGLVDTAMQDQLCGEPQDPKFASVEVLKSKRGTVEMPKPANVAERLVKLFETADRLVDSGGFVDIRQTDI
ncbi:MAG: SDR family NAD(P)-dependent oxidoreductase [Planctomycetota bacterium]